MYQEAGVGENWNLGNEGTGMYNAENEKYVKPDGGNQAQTEHKYTLKDLTTGQKYYFIIQVEIPEQKEIFEFGLEQPEHYFTFTAK
jgi:hypothetical protein